jgi:CRISPR-associated protein Cmr3
MAAWQAFTIAPLDTLFFRDGRPFVAGEGTDAYSVFPPTPLTLQGLIRSKLLAKRRPDGGGGRADGCSLWEQYALNCAPCPHNSRCDVQDVVGLINPSSQPNGNLQVRGPWLLVGSRLILPIPLDVIARADDLKAIAERKITHLQTGLLRPLSGGGRRSNMPEGLVVLAPPEKWEKFEGVPGWMAWDRFEEYLANRPPALTPGLNWWRIEDLASAELRPGLEIEDGRNRAHEGRLYFARHVRLNTWEKAVRLAAEVDGLGTQAGSLTAFAISPFGGERRSVGVEPFRLDSVS